MSNIFLIRKTQVFTVRTFEHTHNIGTCDAEETLKVLNYLTAILYCCILTTFVLTCKQCFNV